VGLRAGVDIFEAKNLLPLLGIKSQIIQYTPAIHNITLRNDIKSDPLKCKKHKYFY
jgi:hypothetical protein